MDEYHRDQQLQELCEEVRVQIFSLNSSTTGECADIDRLTTHAEAELDRGDTDFMFDAAEDPDDMVSDMFAMDS
jgi:hypothetical protein